MLFAGASDGGDTGEDSGDSVDDGTDGSTGSGHAVFISEYIEGSSFNKAVEIYNGSTEAVDLSNYKLKLLSNGATSVGDEKVLELSGTLASGAVATFSHASAEDALTTGSTLSSFVMNFNGDDYIELSYGDVTIDAVGTFGVKTNWGKDVTLVRKASITEGNLSLQLLKSTASVEPL